MTRSLVAMDIGGVLIRTVADAQYRALARLTGRDEGYVAGTLENAGVVAAFDEGRLIPMAFGTAVRSLLDCAALRDEDLRWVWNQVLGDTDPAVASTAAHLARAGRLLLASNTNPFHWAVVKRQLALAGIRAPAVLSFVVGHAKPDPRFFQTLAVSAQRAGREAVYVDDRRENVAAAASHGFAVCLHHAEPRRGHHRV